jgi:phosphate-selective porin OprO and OprP
MNRISQCSCVAICCLMTNTLSAQTTQPSAPTTQETTQDLLNEVRALRSEVKDLRAQVTAQATTQPSAAAVQAMIQNTDNQVRQDADRHSQFADLEGITAGYNPDKGFIIRSEDGNFLLHPWAFVQIRNATTYRENATAKSSDTQNGFELPRAKFIIDGNIYSTDLTYQFIWATSDTTGDLGLQDGWVRYHLPSTPFALEAGQIRDPVDHEQILYATKSLTPGRSIVNNVLLNGDNIVKGASLSYGYDGDYPLRAQIAFTGGERNFDTTFQQFPTNPANYGAAGRVEYKVMGDWNDYTQFTGLNNKEPLLVVGGGIDYTEGGDTGGLTHVVDIQYTQPNGLTLYGAYLGRYVRNNGGSPLTDGTSTGKGPFFDTYDASVRLMAAYLIQQHWEPFVRLEWIDFDSRELAAGTDNVLYDATFGLNYYFYGHRAKLSADVTYLPNGSPITSTIDDLLASQGGNEVIVQVQMQFIF